MPQSQVFNKSANENTNLQLTRYFTDQAAINKTSFAVISSGTQFSVTPEVQRSWIANLKADSEFLNSISLNTYTPQLVENLGISPYGLITSRTDTSNGTKKKQSTSLSGVSEFQYLAVHTDFNVHISFDDLDEWALNAREFQALIADARLQRRRKDLICIGWHGTKHEKTTDPVANPNGEDVNIGWLQRYRTNAPQNVFEQIGGKPITIGEKGTYINVDVAVNEMLRLIPNEMRRGLVVHISDDLLMSRQQKVIEKSTVTELGTKMTQQAEFIVNGLKAYTPDDFPAGTILLTNPKNLIHGVQRQSMRNQHIMDMEADLYKNYTSAKEFYAVYDYRAGVLMEKITLIVDPVTP